MSLGRVNTLVTTYSQYLPEGAETAHRRSPSVSPRDAFHVFNNPEMTPASKATTVQLDEPVVGVYIGGQAKAYPISTLKSSELVNDMCGDVPIAASW